MLRWWKHDLPELLNRTGNHTNQTFFQKTAMEPSESCCLGPDASASFLTVSSRIFTLVPNCFNAIPFHSVCKGPIWPIWWVLQAAECPPQQFHTLASVSCTRFDPEPFCEDNRPPVLNLPIPVFRVCHKSSPEQVLSC